MDPAVILFGLGVGVLVGITGMGGGSLMTPLLILVIGGLELPVFVLAGFPVVLAVIVFVVLRRRALVEAAA